MKRAVLVCALALTTPALAQAPEATGGPIVSQAERDAVEARVRAGASCANCDLFQINLAFQIIPGRDFSGARLRQSDLQLATADGARFARANASLANFFGARLGHADFSEANLTEAIFVGAYLGYARFDHAILTGANFSGAELTGARGLTQDQLNTACGDATTVLPQGMTIPAC